MSVVTAISSTNYLHTSYSPDREYRDGQLLERNAERNRIQNCWALWRNISGTDESSECPGVYSAADPGSRRMVSGPGCLRLFAA